MKDSVYIGSTPCDESCAQVGSNNYEELSRKELKRFVAQIRLELGREPYGAKLRIKSNSHDFGSYSEVECDYNDTIQESVDYAFSCESTAPMWVGYWQVVDNEMHFFSKSKDFLFKRPLSDELNELIEEYKATLYEEA